MSYIVKDKIAKYCPMTARINIGNYCIVFEEKHILRNREPRTDDF